MSTDPRIDDKIARAADFARPILEHFRALVHATLPEVEETIKWGMPHFTYKGKNVAGMAPFKAHCAITIAGVGRQGEGEGMGSYGKVATLADLPADEELRTKLLEGKARVDAGGSAARRAPIPRTSQKPAIEMPDDFASALSRVPNAQAQFDKFSPSARWDYLDWITSSKREETRAKRIAEAVPWIAEGKRRNWKYER